MGRSNLLAASSVTTRRPVTRTNQSGLRSSVIATLSPSAQIVWKEVDDSDGAPRCGATTAFASEQ